MPEIKSFFDLRTWKEAHALTLEIYKMVKIFPPEEKFELSSQLRRAAVSIPSNIAEGMGRGSAKDLIRFLINARGSCHEVVYQLYLSRDLKYIPIETHNLIANRYKGLMAGINSHIDQLQKYK